jgi:predicted subunit of tRNA(5-methylaminomethyl-2-thiouridylate) methyltransferase
MLKNRVLVHYSGGLDSNLCAARLALKNYEIYLVTYDNGLTIHPEVAKVPASLLKERFPVQIVSHEIIPIYGLVKKVALKFIEEDFKKYEKNRQKGMPKLNK